MRRWSIEECVGWGLFALALVILSLSYQSERAAVALIGLTGAFAGFYFSEIAKKAIRARHVAQQAFCYLTSTKSALSFQGIPPIFNQLVENWTKDRVAVLEKNGKSNGSDLIFTQVDGKHRDIIKDCFAHEQVVAETVAEWRKLKEIPGKMSTMIAISERTMDLIQNWPKQLPDEDIALLGPEILFHYLQFRSNLHLVMLCNFEVASYVQDSRLDTLQAEYLIPNLERMISHHVLSQVELSMLFPLLLAAREKSLLAHSVALIGLKT